MIEKTVLDHLNREIPAYMELPETYPATPFVVVQKTGSSRESHISRATIAVQSYGATLYEAAQTNERVKELMEALTARDEITKVSLNSDYNFTDTAAKRYRYQAVFGLVHY